MSKRPFLAHVDITVLRWYTNDVSRYIAAAVSLGPPPPQANIELEIEQTHARSYDPLAFLLGQSRAATGIILGGRACALDVAPANLVHTHTVPRARFTLDQARREQFYPHTHKYSKRHADTDCDYALASHGVP